MELSVWQTQGAQHTKDGTMCQDAALVSSFEWGWAGVVSDGCSTGVASETGAWILARTAMEELKHVKDPLGFDKQSFLWKVLFRAEAAAHLMGISMKDALATLVLVLVSSEDNKARWIVWGDGSAGIMELSEEKALKVWGVSSIQNSPFYPGYLLTPDRLALWESQLEAVKYGWVGFEEIASVEDQKRGLEASFDLNPGRLVVITSDGVSSFLGETAYEVLQELQSMKGMMGSFLPRRMGRALKNRMEKGIIPQDDFAMVGILNLAE